MTNGFTFNGQHSSKFVKLTKISHTLKPEKRVNKLVIAGRDGTYDTSDETYANITISFECVSMDKNIRAAAREIAAWLSVSGELILDEESDKIYNASIHTSVPIDEAFILNDFVLTFECFPFAMSLPNQVNAVITNNGQEILISANGTAKTPCVITIKNTGTTNINNLRLTHRKEV